LILGALATVKESIEIALPEVFVDSDPGLLYKPFADEAEKLGRGAVVSGFI
jgi:hypothetical protein